MFILNFVIADLMAIWDNGFAKSTEFSLKQDKNYLQSFASKYDGLLLPTSFMAAFLCEIDCQTK